MRPRWLRLPLALRIPLLMSLNELTSASCINIILTKCVQVSIPLLYLSVSCFLTTLENLDRSINPSICAKRLILVLDMVLVLFNPKVRENLNHVFFAYFGRFWHRNLFGSWS